MIYLVAIALAIALSFAVGTWLAPTPSSRDIPPNRLQQGGNWSERPPDPEEDDG